MDIFHGFHFALSTAKNKHYPIQSPDAPQYLGTNLKSG